jgi:hypothetical protein
MGEIINRRNFNLYSGEYSRKAKSTPQDEIWDIKNLFLERFPVLALRKRKYTDWPLSWKKDRNLRQAIDLTLETLKAWKAFRSRNPKKSTIKNLREHLPRNIYNFQSKMLKYHIKNSRDIRRLNQYDYNKILEAVSRSVGDISIYKTDKTPMLGSKIMNFFFPEIFPVWDRRWVGKSLSREDLRNEILKDRLPNEIRNELSDCNIATSEYAEYFALMLNDLDKTPIKKYKSVEEAFIRFSKIPDVVIHWHFDDIAPVLFEICLIGKHFHEIKK